MLPVKSLASALRCEYADHAGRAEGREDRGVPSESQQVRAMGVEQFYSAQLLRYARQVRMTECVLTVPSPK